MTRRFNAKDSFFQRMFECERLDSENEVKKTKSCIIIIVPFRYQDLHTKSYIMVFASQRWLGVRLDCLSALLTAATALASVIASQDAGNYTCIRNQQINPCLYELLNFLENLNCLVRLLLLEQILKSVTDIERLC